ADRAVAAAGEQRRPADRAERLREAVLRRPRADRILAGGDAEVLGRDPGVGRSGGARASLAAGAVGVAGPPGPGGWLVAGPAAGAAAGHHATPARSAPATSRANSSIVSGSAGGRAIIRKSPAPCERATSQRSAHCSGVSTVMFGRTSSGSAPRAAQ